MSAASISQFDERLVNQQRQINDCISRLFDSKYLTTLRSNTVTAILKSAMNKEEGQEERLSEHQFS